MSDTLAHANALMHELRVGLDYSGTQRPAIIKTLSALIHDLGNAQQRNLALEHATEVLARENADAKADILRQAARMAALESEIAMLQASVIEALSGAGPEVIEDERTA